LRPIRDKDLEEISKELEIYSFNKDISSGDTFSSISQHITFLTVALREDYEKVDQIINSLAKIPSNIKSLKLLSIYDSDVKRMIKIFQKIPPSISTLIIHSFDPKSYSETDVILFCDNIPPTIIRIISPGIKSFRGNLEKRGLFLNFEPYEFVRREALNREKIITHMLGFRYNFYPKSFAETDSALRDILYTHVSKFLAPADFCNLKATCSSRGMPRSCVLIN